MLLRRLSLLIPLLLPLASPCLAQTPESAKADYDLLQRWRFRGEPIPVPAGGLRWSDEGGACDGDQERRKLDREADLDG